MTRFERWDDALGAAELFEGIERLAIGDGAVRGAARVLEEGVLRANAGVIEAGRNAMRLDHLAVLILQKIALRTVEHAHTPLRERSRVPIGIEPFAGRLDAKEFDLGIADEFVKEPHRVRTAADARDKGIREFSDPLE